MDAAERAQKEAAILQANQAFYQAFSRGDFAAMNELWARGAPVACLHPGAPLLSGRAAVLGSWRQILNVAPSFGMVAREPRVCLLGDAAFVTCLEANGTRPAHLIATNVFVWEEESWRMVHHHAGPLTKPEPVRATRSEHVN
jgi:ketosteroid isomerase-like protein